MRKNIRVAQVIVAIAACASLAGACGDSTPQQPSPSILVNPGAVGVPVTGQTGSTITVTANVAWTVTSDSSAATITSGASGNGNGSFTYSVAANTGAQRTVHLIVTGSTAVATVTLTQVGAFVR